MSGSESESDGEPLVRVNSGPKRFSKAPTDKEFKIKIVDTKRQKFSYILKEGCTLPYETELCGKFKVYKKCFAKLRLSCISK